jgi:hypothetical protein
VRDRFSFFIFLFRGRFTAEVAEAAEGKEEK